MIQDPQCHDCRHLYPIDGKCRGFFCSAYPSGEGVPMDILTNDHDHTTPYPGDNGITFEPKEREDGLESVVYR